ncbi:MAG: molybdopterin-dependent oxidoreductase, partial [Myxococcota bacterium]|nr:molybdopterin-dependent oxidoreductase [Myxococcota bacterium]
DAIFAGSGDGPGEVAARWIEAAVLTPDELAQQAHQIELVQVDGRIDVVDRDALCALPDGVSDVSTLVPGRTGAAARVRALLERFGVSGPGSAVICAADGFASEPVKLAALAEGVLLHTLAGEALPPGKGGPFRLLIPEGVADAPSACANVKAVTRIVVREEVPG